MGDYLKRLLLEIPCAHPVIFLRDMKLWELQALLTFMYCGEVYTEQQHLATLMQAADVLQIHGLSLVRESSLNDSNTQSSDSNPPVTSPTPTHDDVAQVKTENASSTNESNPDSPACSTMATTSTANGSSVTITPVSLNSNTSNLNMERSEAPEHPEKALSDSCDATEIEVKMETDKQVVQQHNSKSYSINTVRTSNRNTRNSLPVIEATCQKETSYGRRRRRSEKELKQASDMVACGMTFQRSSDKYKIPISTIRFYMARKGMLKKRKRGRASLGTSSQPIDII
ncbi:protein abrupt isoform X2 [Ooceraea biroi]|uniref:protein abrupt isoform X2 n=1 Tax=Ooceraea biroi TaxID=2015173 RepID=UPI0005B872A7|nr:protein abrupt isoform X2 [Ooceraea biroi]